MADAESAPVFRKFVSKNSIKNRKRPAERHRSFADDDSDTEVVQRASTQQKRLIEKKRRGNFSGRIRKTDDASSSESSDGEEQRQKMEIDVKYASEGVGRVGPSDMGATAVSHHDTEHSSDPTAQRERIKKLLENMEKKRQQEGEQNRFGGASSSKAGSKDGKKEKLYEGQAMYDAKFKVEKSSNNSMSGQLGPIRNKQYMRSSIRWDYAPDICKDYKETGFCTFGDSCKFLHDRSDYKHGWELERDWQEGKLKEADDNEFLVSSAEEDEDGEEFPFACYICREEFKSPIATKCKHFFCEACAVARCRTKCAVCGEKTNGQFSVARKLIEKLAERAAGRDTKKKRHGEDSDDDDVDLEDAADDLPPEMIMEDAREQEDEDEEEENGDQDDEASEDGDER